MISYYRKVDLFRVFNSFPAKKEQEICLKMVDQSSGQYKKDDYFLKFIINNSTYRYDLKHTFEAKFILVFFSLNVY